MLTGHHAHSAYTVRDENNFLKTEADINNDLRVRVSASFREHAAAPSSSIKYNRVINRLDDEECNLFLAERALFVEENY